MWCRPLNRFFSLGWVRRRLSTPAAEHQTDIEGYYRRHRMEGIEFLESFGAAGEVSGERVLDLGCGLGIRTMAVAEAGAAAAVGVDSDLEKIHRARTQADLSGVRSVSYSVQCGTSLAFDAAHFDVVLVLDVMEHLGDPTAVLRECARVLRRGGRVLIGFPPYRSPWGGHLFTHVPIPWAQQLFPDRELLEVWREVHQEMVARGEFRCSPERARAIEAAKTTADLWGCNGMTVAAFLDLVDHIPLELKLIRFKTFGNLGGSLIMRSTLREYLVTRLVAVLEV